MSPSPTTPCHAARAADRELRSRRSRAWRGIAALVSVTILAITISCSGTTRSYSRLGRAGAITFLSGGAVAIVGAHSVAYRNETAGYAMASVGGTAQIVSALLMVYALDSLMEKEAEEMLGRPVHRRGRGGLSAPHADR